MFKYFYNLNISNPNSEIDSTLAKPGATCHWLTRISWTWSEVKRHTFSNLSPASGTITLGRWRCGMDRSNRVSLQIILHKIQSKIMSQCRPDRTERGRVARMRPGGNLCPAARKKGIALLHGNCQVPPPSVFLFAIIANIGLLFSGICWCGYSSHWGVQILEGPGDTRSNICQTYCNALWCKRTSKVGNYIKH